LGFQNRAGIFPFAISCQSAGGSILQKRKFFETTTGKEAMKIFRGGFDRDPND